MSRSYKQAIYRDGYGSCRKKQAKRRANKDLRRIAVDSDSPFYSSHTSYKRHTNPWDICDYILFNLFDREPNPEQWGFTYFTGQFDSLKGLNHDRYHFRKWFKRNGKWHWWK
jgi:hypothetical protein